MARIRTIKPSFFRSDDVSALPFRARLTWVGLWTQCDDQGRTKDHARLIKADIWPLDNVSLADIEEDLATLAGHGRIVRYEVDGQRFLEVTNWSEHQKIDRPSKSNIPAPNGSAPAAQLRAEPRGTDPQSYPQSKARVPLDEDASSTRPGKGKEGKGREGKREAREPTPEPLPRCEKHQDNPDPPPCGGCAEARKIHAKWQAERNTRLANAPKCRTHRGQPAHNCGGCRVDAAEARAAS